MKAINIKWDIDKNYDGDLDELQMLPNEIEIPEGMTDEDEISDYISYISGFCHNGFDLQGTAFQKDKDLLIQISDLCYKASNNVYETEEMESFGILNLCDQLTESIDKFLKRNDYSQEIEQDEIDLE